MPSLSRSSILAIRPATDDDAAAIVRLAALDSAEPPTGALLVGVVDGQPLAALSLATGAVVADPFSPTDDLVGLLRQRALRLQGDGAVRTQASVIHDLATRLWHRPSAA